MPQYRRKPPTRKPRVGGFVIFNLLLSLVVFFSLINTLGKFGDAVKNIVYGIFGLSAFGLVLFSIIYSIRKLINSRIYMDKSRAVRYIPLFFIGILCLHTISTKKYIYPSFKEYVLACYTNGNANAGGIIGGVLLYYPSKLGSNFALAILLVAFFSVAFISLYPLFLNTSNYKTKKVKYRKPKVDEKYSALEKPVEFAESVGSDLFIGSPDGSHKNNKIIRKSGKPNLKPFEEKFSLLYPNKLDVDAEVISSENDTLIDKIKKKNSYTILFEDNYDNSNAKIKRKESSKPKVVIDTKSQEPSAMIFPTVSKSQKAYEEKRKSVVRPKPIVAVDDKYKAYTNSYMREQIKNSLDTGVNIKSKPTKRLNIFDEDNVKPEKREETSRTNSDLKRLELAKKRLYGNADNETPDKNFESIYVNKPKIENKYISKRKTSKAFDKLFGDDRVEERNETPKRNLDVDFPIIKPIKEYREERKTDLFDDLPSMTKKSKPKKSNYNEFKEIDIRDTGIPSKTRYIAPPEELLKTYQRVESEGFDEHQERCDALHNVLMEYGINTVVDRYTVGPSFTRYEITMPNGVTVKKIQNISDDIAMRLRAKKMRLEAPIPGKNAVGVEIANKVVSTVGLRECIHSTAFKKHSELSFVLGKDISGNVHTCNIVKMPHLLIAGATGAGKSVCINSLVCSLIYKYNPDELRLLLIDPKRVELAHYNGLPHLLIPQIIFDAEKAVNALTWATKEMERRYELFHNMRVRNLEEHNKKARLDNMPIIPYIVIIIDELADLMTYKKREIEEKIKRLAQLARAAGIHLIFATQRPSVDIITGTIKANFPSRIAFSVTSFADSKTILDHGGAEKLRGQGDMLYQPVINPDPVRLQGAFITNNEVEAITNFVRQNNPCYFDENIENEIMNMSKKNKGHDDIYAHKSEDEVFAPALKMIIDQKQASISMIQRRFSVGYARAARLIDEMEQRGYIGPAEGSKPRNVRISLDEYMNLYGDA